MRITGTRRRTWSIALACALATVCLASALGASAALGQDETATPVAEGKVAIKIGWMEEVDSLNPLIGWTENAYEVYVNEYLLMVGRDWNTLKPTDTGIAKSWEVSDDGLVWTFHVNEGLTWHDGEEVTADDAAFTYNFIIENQIANFITFLTGVDRAEVVDKYTYRVFCKQPVANMLNVWLVCLPEHVFGEMSAKEATVTFENDPPCIGNGPWQVVEWKRDDYLRMAANPGFLFGAPKTDELLFVVYQNGDTMVQDFLAGNLDAIYMFPPAQFDKVKGTEGVETREYLFWNWDYVGFNCYEGESGGHPALRDPQFRSALEYAIDRARIVENAYGGRAIPGYTFLPPGGWSDPDYAWAPDESEARNYDPDTANQMLDDAGYPDTNGDGVREYKGKPIKLRLWAESGSPEAARACKQITGWWEAVGIDVAFTVQDQGVYFDSIWGYKGDAFYPDFDAYYWLWDGYWDPGQTLTCFSPAQVEGWNEFSWVNEEYGRLDKLQAKEMDADQRAQYIHQMQQVMYGDSPCIVTVHPYKLQAYRTSSWDGWELTGNGGKDGPEFAFRSASMPWAYSDLTPKAAQGEEESSLAPWVGIIVVIVLVVGIAVWLIVRRRRGGPAMEQ
jgi:peptide/nickel transport system substrate-binding protein